MCDLLMIQLVGMRLGLADVEAKCHRKVEDLTALLYLREVGVVEVFHVAFAKMVRHPVGRVRRREGATKRPL